MSTWIKSIIPRHEIYDEHSRITLRFEKCWYDWPHSEWSARINRRWYDGWCYRFLVFLSFKPERRRQVYHGAINTDERYRRLCVHPRPAIWFATYRLWSILRAELRPHQRFERPTCKICRERERHFDTAIKVNF